MPRVLLLSTYELGHQPLGLARPAAELTAAGHVVDCQDLAVDPLDEARVRAAELIGVSVPMHTATRLGARVAERVRALNPRAHLTFYGLYAGLHADVLLGRLADSVIGGEFEGPLVALADALKASFDPAAPIPGVWTVSLDGGTFLGRRAFGLPRRDLLPPLERYARVDVGDRRKLVGYVEASRGCAHRCLHCPITPVYAGRLRIVGQDAVLDDIDQLVRLGAEHITFGDPDFFNGIRHSLRIVEALHAALPGVTFDATIKVEHILEHREHIPTLARNGCLFVVSAVEAVQDHILANFRKGHSAAAVVEALRITAAAGLPIRPTFVPFTPWTSRDDYLGLLDFIACHGLVRHVDPIQLAIRLLVPRGSSLVGTPAMAPHLGPFDPETFSYGWSHPDPRMDGLQAEVADRVEQAVRAGEDASDTFAAVVALAEAAAGPDHRPVAPVREPALVGTARSFVPRLTESWFC
ncbi:MAG: CUAEP/CCAEP-tail radical SAM protein [Chloroflexota bacterium]|nr:CUAEP/CCAEP-tail radical SAM protein [Chloroflexota bacterium]